MTSPNNDLLYKALLVGESGVGKTSLIRALTGCPFSHNMLTTVGIDFVKVPFNVDGAQVSLQIWDTAGQERFRSITKFQYRGCKGLLLVYDITDRSTFETLSYWMASIERELELDVGEPVPVVVVANKKDLVSQRQVSEQEGRALADKFFLAGFFETSACDGSNVVECFQRLASCIVEVFDPEQMSMYKMSAEITTLKKSAVFLPENNINNNSGANNSTKNNKNATNKNKKNKKKHKKKIFCHKNIRLDSRSLKLPKCQC